MSVPFAAAVGLAVTLVALGLPYGWRLARSPGWTLAVTPATAGLACSAAVVASLLTRSPMAPWLVALALVGWGLVVVDLAGRRGTGWDGLFVVPGADDDAPGPAVAIVAGVVAIIPVVLVDLPATESDARWIWWFHAAWFRAGGDAARTAMSDPAYAPSRPAYPPLVPAVIASVWHVGGAYQRELALRVTQLFTAAAITTTAYVVTATARPSRRSRPAVALLVVVLAWSVNVGVGLSGFVDLTWSALLVPAAVLLLAGPPTRRAVGVAAVLAAAAALTKYEGQAAALLLVLLALAQHRDRWRKVAPAAAAVVAAIATWQVVAVVGEAPRDERGGWSNLGTVFDPGETWPRLVDAVPALIGELGWLVGLSAAAVLALVVAGRLAGRPLRQPGLVSMLVLASAYLAFLALTLEDFADAAYRTVMVVRLLVLVDLLLALIAAWRALGLLAPAAPVTGAAETRADEDVGEVVG